MGCSLPIHGLVNKPDDHLFKVLDDCGPHVSFPPCIFCAPCMLVSPHAPYPPPHPASSLRGAPVPFPHLDCPSWATSAYWNYTIQDALRCHLACETLPWSELNPLASMFLFLCTSAISSSFVGQLLTCQIAQEAVNLWRVETLPLYTTTLYLSKWNRGRLYPMRQHVKHLMYILTNLWRCTQFPLYMWRILAQRG